MPQNNTSSVNGTSLLLQRRFLPYFMTQFLGAFNDNMFKNVLLILVAFAGSHALPVSSNLFINLAAGLFILPFILFSATAGALADKYDKDWFIRKVKLAEIAIMALGAIGFITQNYAILLLLLFLMGIQSAFFGPVKYALLPHHLKSEELLSGNALVETGTFLAILLGTIGAGVIASGEKATYVAAIAVVVFSLLGYLASCYIPSTPAANPTAKVRWQPITQTKHTLHIAKKDNITHKAILAISWFWFLGACYLTQFPNFTKLYLNGGESAVTFLLALFSVGIAVGSQLCDRLSRKRIELGIVPIGSLGITCFGVLMVYSVPETLPQLNYFVDFVSHRPLWPTFIYLLFIGIFGGLFIVPLYTVIQYRAENKECSQVIAANNIYNSLFMVASALLGIFTLSVLKISIPSLLLLIAILNILVTIYLFSLLPVYVAKFLTWILTHTLYRITHANLHHLPEKGGALLVCNHVSYMDALLLSAASPRLIRFVMEEKYANLKPIQGFLKHAKVIPITATNRTLIRKAFKEVEQALLNGDIVCIFPEGQLTCDGNIQPFMRGMDIILRRSPVPVIPIALKGMWGSYFSRHKGRACKGLPKRFRSKVEIEAGTPVAPESASAEFMQQQVTLLRGDNL